MTKATGAKKDVIYVDIEDDITSVIEKVKEAESSIVALVPPKRIGVLQSIVNLKLLQRAAKTAKKHVVLITNDHGLMALSADLSIPVAKNLQSKPMIPAKIEAGNEEDDIINGEDLPISDHIRASDGADSTAGLGADGVAINDTAASTLPSGTTARKSAAKKSLSVPNFDIFRKKMFIFGSLGVLVLAFLVWALFFAGHASVSVTAKTNIVNIARTLQLKPAGSVDAAQSTAPAVVKEIKKVSSVTFTPTGKKNVGDKAIGTAKLSQQALSSATVPAGTALTTNSGLVFRTDTAVTVPASTFGPGCFPTACAGSATVGVTAAEGGTEYNGASGTLNGAPSGISASLPAATSGGTDRTVTIVSQDDIDKAKEQLQAQKADSVKAELLKQFDDTIVVIQESYKVSAGDPTSVPALDQEATTAKLSAETTYRIVGISRANLIAIYDAYTKTQIEGEKNQKIYRSGDETTSFAQFTDTDGIFRVKATATAQVGPNIDEAQLAAQIAGKRSGEIQQLIETIQGVEDVNVKLSPFWVTKAPTDAKKIDIEFIVTNG